ncbi:hypothetical protein OGAPHI_001180 [Ogataea philodendri]|uniref:Uncharacterized protein n=1 Tax=Ogataea philodendri TaxID=1378263 RepID=A0A9P8PFG9_9ASCO|nr:uncharacterized protein OGAPHI_001180 [Ogataea philodendri]KAH3670665.1 hypothetical protein OGAPHI_001180 [Ogataea philodendri]
MDNHENISVETIARLFNTVAFEDRKVKISQKTLELVAEYIRLFTSEAIVRSNEERLEERRRDNGRYQVDLDEQVDTRQQDAVLDTLSAYILGIDLEHLIRVQDPVRVQSELDLAHKVDGVLAKLLNKIVSLSIPDTVLSSDGTFCFQSTVHHALHHFFAQVVLVLFEQDHGVVIAVSNVTQNGRGQAGLVNVVLGVLQRLAQSRDRNSNIGGPDLDVVVDRLFTIINARP